MVAGWGIKDQTDGTSQSENNQDSNDTNKRMTTSTTSTTTITTTVLTTTTTTRLTTATTLQTTTSLTSQKKLQNSHNCGISLQLSMTSITDDIDPIIGVEQDPVSDTGRQDILVNIPPMTGEIVVDGEEVTSLGNMTNI